MNKSSAISAFILLIYLALLPQGLPGVVLAGLALAISLVGLSAASLCIVSLIALPPVLGQAASTLALGIPGSLPAYVFGLGYFCLSIFKVKSTKGITAPAIWITVVLVVIAMSLLWGPQTPYSYEKLLEITINLAIYTIVFIILFTDKRVEVSRVGQSCILACTLSLAILIYNQPYYAPTSLFNTAAVRIAGMAEGYKDSDLASNTLGFLGAWGCVFTLTGLVSKGQRAIKLLLSYFFFISGLLVLNVIGARLFLLSPIIALFLTVNLKSSANATSRRIFALGIFMGITVFSLYLLEDTNVFLAQIFDSNSYVDERLNRAVNWRAALEISQNAPLFGYGLGGYFIPNLSMPGEGTYAHNIFLEILTEQGLVGLGIIFVPLLVHYFSNRFAVLSSRGPTGLYFAPIYVYVLAAALISHDLTKTISYLALCCVAWFCYGVMTQRYLHKSHC